MKFRILLSTSLVLGVALFAAPGGWDIGAVPPALDTHDGSFLASNAVGILFLLSLIAIILLVGSWLGPGSGREAA